MTDILYVIGPDEQTHNNLPLRYSLRALDKYAEGVGNLYVVGYIPKWLTGPMRHLEVQNIGFGKHWNILNCICEAVQMFGIDHDFLYSSDDHFLLKPCNMDEWPRFEKGTLYTTTEYERKHGKQPGKYQKSIIATRGMYDAEGLEPIMSCCHMNTWMDGRMVAKVRELTCKYHLMSPNYGIEPTCTFTAASMLSGRKLEFEHTDDVKLKSLEDIERYVALGKRAVSLQQGLENNSNVINWFRKTYPEKSRWEM